MNCSADMRGILYYNEKKVRQKEAECIHAGNFLKDARQLSYEDKRQRFAHQNELNQRTKRNAVHIFLRFTAADQLDNNTMADIAAAYMQRVGFGDQPYLVYRHLDIALPHLHIVTTLIRADGRRIPDHHFIPWHSEPARIALEAEFSLAKQNERKELQPHASTIEKLRYGNQPIIPALTEALQYILHSYRYRSLSELNAILRLYNIVAISGRPGSRLQRFGGLLYQVLDEKGRGRGSLVKASSLSFKPTLSWLENKFRENRQLDPAILQDARLSLDEALRQNPADNAQFQDALRRSQLAAGIDRDAQGAPVGLLLVDLAAKAVVNTMELGPGYDPVSLRKRLPFDPLQPSLATTQAKQTTQQKKQRSRRL